jgi:hypothetical protein
LLVHLRLSMIYTSRIVSICKEKYCAEDMRRSNTFALLTQMTLISACQAQGLKRGRQSVGAPSNR